VITVRAPAKINLQLSVGPRRSDGYHELVSIFHAVDLCDEVTVDEAVGGVELVISGEGAAELPVDDTNLAVRAAHLLADHHGIEPGIRIQITKAIPVAAGMAGGSADAAAVLVACDALWRTRTDRETLVALAAELGSDVPFALQGGTAVGTGRGEQLSPVLAHGALHWVFAIADEGLSTPAVYAQFDLLNSDPPAPEVSIPLVQALRSGAAAAVGAQLHNDLQPAALTLRPGLGPLLDAGTDFGALGAVVCGSGPTCAFLVRDAETSIDLAVALTSTGLCRTVKRGSGPAPGVR
jgi:4-diphosphocytidyl-2-C-methyl-D-erythritol kinase